MTGSQNQQKHLRGSEGPRTFSVPSCHQHRCHLLPGTGSAAHLVKNHPVGVDLGVTLWVQDHRLIGSEIRQRDLGALGTHVHPVHHGVVIKVVLTDVSHAVC